MARYHLRQGGINRVRPDKQFIQEIRDFYKKLKKRCKARSNKTDCGESPVGDSPHEQDQKSDATDDSGVQTVIHDPGHKDCLSQKAHEYFDDLMERDSPDFQPIMEVVHCVLQPGLENPSLPPYQSTLGFNPVRMVEEFRETDKPDSVRLMNRRISQCAAIQNPHSGMTDKSISVAESCPEMTGFEWQSKFVAPDSLQGEPI